MHESGKVFWQIKFSLLVISTKSYDSCLMNHFYQVNKIEQSVEMRHIILVIRNPVITTSDSSLLESLSATVAALMTTIRTSLIS